MFNATKAEEEDTRKLVRSINTNLDPTVPESRVDRLFDKFWPDLKEDLDAIPAPSGAAPTKRSPDEIAAENLELLRSIAPLIQDIAAETDIMRRNRLFEKKFLESLANLPPGTNLVTSTNTPGTSGSGLRVVNTVPLNSLKYLNTENIFTPTESTPPLNKPKPKPTPPSPKKIHAPRPRRRRGGE